LDTKDILPEENQDTYPRCFNDHQHGVKTENKEALPFDVHLTLDGTKQFEEHLRGKNIGALWDRMVSQGSIC
jgi:hypothetical protein